MTSQQALIQEAQAALEGVSSLAVSELVTLLSALRGTETSYDGSDAIRDAVLEALPALADKWGDAAATLAADFYETYRDELGAKGAFTPTLAPPPSADKVETLARWGVGPLYQASPDLDAAISNLSGGLDHLVTDAHRTTVMASSDADPEVIGWTRHASSNACAFCALIASSGRIYRSEESATRRMGRKYLGGTDYRAIERGATREARLAGTRKRVVAAGGRKGFAGTDGYGGRYHNDCHCVAVPVYRDVPHEEAPYNAEWRQAYYDANTTDLHKALAAMRASHGLR